MPRAAPGNKDKFRGPLEVSCVYILGLGMSQIGALQMAIYFSKFSCCKNTDLGPGFRAITIPTSQSVARVDRAPNIGSASCLF